MAKLLSGTRVYGNLTVDGNLNLPSSGNIVIGIQYTPHTNAPLDVSIAANSFVQINVQNIDSVGTLNSSDFVATAPNGTDSTNFIDLGINGNNFVSSGWTMSGKNDGYVYIDGGNLTLGTSTANKTVSVHVGGTLAANIITTFSSSNVTVNGNLYATSLYGNIGGGSVLPNVYITGSLIPTANVAYDLGTPTQKFRSAYFSGNTVYIGSESISVATNGTWTFTSAGANVNLGVDAVFNPPSANISGNTTIGQTLTVGGNISNVRLGPSGILTFADGTTQTTAATGGGGGSSNNYSNVNVKAYTESMGYTNYSNVNVAAYTQTQGYTNYSNVNLSAYLGGTVTIGGNLSVNGNLFVNGNVTVFNANNLSINDSLIYLADDNPADIIDIGFVSSFTSGAGYQHTGFVRDASDGVWKLFANVIAEPTTTVDFTNANYSSLYVGNIQTTASANIGSTLNVVGNILGSAGTLSSLTVNGVINSTGNLTVGSGGEQKINVITAQGNISIGNVTASGSSDAGITFNGGQLITSGIFTEVNGNVLSYGINMSQVTTPDTTIAGGIFRLDVRSVERKFSVLRRPAGSAAEFTAFEISLDNGLTTIASNVLVGNTSTSFSNVRIIHTTPSTNSATGALQVSGGVGISGNINAGAVGAVSGQFHTFVGNITQTSSGGAVYINTTGNIIAANISAAGGSITGINAISPAGNAAVTLGSLTNQWSTIYGRATTAQYADLAEIYTSDKKYVPGTVLVFGGDKEVTISELSHDTRIAGVISTNPAYLMNSTETGVEVALTGRVPCRVKGPVAKGDRLVSSDQPGVAVRLDKTLYEPGCIIGKSLEEITDDRVHTIEVVVGRL